MHVVGLVESPEHVCCRYRLAAYRAAWEEAGHRLELRAIPRGFLARMRLWWSLRAADVVILQRRLLARTHLLMLRRHVRRLVFDFDDLVFERDSYAAHPGASAVRQRRFAATLHAADLVVAGNDFLAAEAARFTRPDKVRVVPTCVEPDWYPAAAHERKGEGVQLVWVGSSSTLQGLERRRPLLDTIARHLPGVVLKVICDRFPRLRAMPVIEVPWSAATEEAEIAGADIGISWLPDDRWSRGKCGLKVLQYMAAGLPVVANRVGVQPELVRHGETGYLADTPQQWVEAVARLAGDPELRRHLGRNGRRLVEQRYSVAAGGRRWLELLAARPSRAAA
jgi:glycosyltransferase involved in cell wall biosynthesis